LIFTKNGLGYILGDFVTNSSGHPVLNLRNAQQKGVLPPPGGKTDHRVDLFIQLKQFVQ
jgi:hypothetical protein